MYLDTLFKILVSKAFTNSWKCSNKSGVVVIIITTAVRYTIVVCKEKLITL
jgi:hypothetical protein